MVGDIPHFLHFTSVPATIEKVMSLHFDDDLLAITIVLGTRKPIVRPGFPVIGLFHVFTLKSQPGPASYSDISYIYIYISWHIQLDFSSIGKRNQAGLAEAHHRLRTFKNSVSSEVQGVTNTEDRGWGMTLEVRQEDNPVVKAAILTINWDGLEKLISPEKWKMVMTGGVDDWEVSGLRQGLLGGELHWHLWAPRRSVKPWRAPAVGVWILGWCGMMWVSWLKTFTRFKITFSHPRLNRGFEWKAIKSYTFLCAPFSAWFWLRKLVQKGIKPADIREARHHFLAGKSTNITPKDRKNLVKSY